MSAISHDDLILRKHWVAKTRRRIQMMKEVTKLLEANARGRPYRGLFYALLATAGVILVIDPTRQLGQAGSVRWVWAVFMVVGTITSLSGVIRDRWRLEWYGLPLQFSALGGLVFVLATVKPTTAALAFACITASPLPVVSHRFVALYRLMKATKRMVKHNRGEV